LICISIGTKIGETRKKPSIRPSLASTLTTGVKSRENARETRAKTANNYAYNRLKPTSSLVKSSTSSVARAAHRFNTWEDENKGINKDNINSNKVSSELNSENKIHVSKKRAAVVNKCLQTFNNEQLNIINDLREDLITSLNAFLVRSRQFKSAFELLENRLVTEDKSGGGTLSRPSLFAALTSLSISPHLYFGNDSNHKIDIIEKLEKLSNDGKIMINDFLALSFYF
jgi:hypothetical protein